MKRGFIAVLLTLCAFDSAMAESKAGESSEKAQKIAPAVVQTEKPAVNANSGDSKSTTSSEVKKPEMAKSPEVATGEKGENKDAQPKVDTKVTTPEVSDKKVETPKS